MFFFVRHISESSFHEKDSPILLVFFCDRKNARRRMSRSISRTSVSIPGCTLTLTNKTRSINGRVPASIAIVPSPTMEDCGWEPNGREFKFKFLHAR